MRIFIILFSGIILLWNVSTVFGQEQEGRPQRRGSRIIDDTTKQVYGPKTSRYYHEKDIFYNREIFYPIDTLIRNFHQYNYVHRNQNLYQDLGNIGTAIRPIYYQSPEIIGATSGFRSFDLYWDREQIRYFDTKSPYSNMNVILGGKGRSITRVMFSRNINPRWNFGFTYRGLFIDKQVQRRGKGDRIARSNYYDFYTTYQNKDSTYRLFLNFRRNFHQVDEYGGIMVADEENYVVSDFTRVNAQPWLTAAESNDLRNNLHLFHQYKFGKGFQLYHVSDLYRQRNKFIDIYSLEPKEYFDYIEIDNDSSYDEVNFKTFRNEAGIKGTLLKLFYNGYAAVRNYSMTYNHIQAGDVARDLKRYETYLGGRMSLKLDSLVEVSGVAELLMETGNYKIEGDIKSKWFEASLKQVQYAPDFVSQLYRGSHDFWENNFSAIESTQINGYVHYNSRRFVISPGFTLTRLRNYVFYKKYGDYSDVQEMLPVQSSGSQIVASPELRLSLTFLKHVTLSNRTIFTSLLDNSDDAIRLPEVFVNAQLSYANIFFNGNLDMHAGVDVHWKSPYKALGYDPVIQQFFTQDTFRPGLHSFPIVDIFFNAKIKRGRIFIKYNNLVQAITKTGYLPTPFYPGQRSILDFGFDWSFYD